MQQQKKKLTPEDLAEIHATYREHSAHLRWMLRSVLLGAVAGAGLAAVFGHGHIALTNPAFWVGSVYGASLPVFPGMGPSFFLLGPVEFVKELGRRFSAIAAGRRALKERFKDRDEAEAGC